ncbi:MAG: lytic transglycosylase domain-containing protein [Pseudomonadota bacterium]
MTILKPALFAAIAAFALLFSASTASHALTPERSDAALAVLSDADAALYRDIFDLQERGAWKAADAKINALENDILMGHVQFQRYMHPTAYRSSYAELKKWMAYYADHPEASKVYRLALKRRPKRASAPVRPIPRKWRNPEPFALHPDLAADYQKTSKPRLTQIEGRVRYLARKEQATRAGKEIARHLKNRVITERQYDRMRSWIAASLYYQGYVDSAERIAVEVAARNGDSAVLSYWISGLIAFRKGDMDAARAHFGAMAAVPYQDDALRAGAGFWAGRAALASGDAAAVADNLEIAARFPFTFYGQLALAQLGRDVAYDWTPPTISNAEFNALADKYKGVARAVALAQVGQIVKAETELRRVNGSIDDDEAEALLAVAAAVDLPAAQIDIALASNDKGFASGLFPVPAYTPENGFEADRAVLFALMRQESKFKTDATSRVGARGLMQLMPRTASFIANDRSLRQRKGRNRLYDPSLNMRLGQTYVNQLITRHTDGDLFHMALAYNGGPGNLRRWRKKVAIDDPLLFIESIPNPESRDFVEKVLTNVWVYRARLGQPAPTRDKVAAGELPLYEAIDQLTAAP